MTADLDPLEDLIAAVRDQGGLLAGALVPVPREVDGAGNYGVLTAAGPRAAADPAEYALIIEAIREGYLLHYSSGRVVAPADGDLALLAGDCLYALGLARLSRLGDVEAIVELADVIALSALAQATRDLELAEAVWAAGVRAIGWGSNDAHAEAKRLVRRGDPTAAAAMRAAGAPVATH